MYSTDHHPRRHRQTGQSIIWFLATMAACCCAFALVYNVGQMANNKESTTNAADASALSGALVEARMLNFHAYANRAVIANQVTVAQLTATDSFFQYSTTLLQNLATYISAIPIVGEIAGPPLETAAEAAQEALNIYQTTVAPGAIQGLEGIDTELKAAADLAYNAGAVSASRVSSDIAQANATSLVNEAAMLAANQSAWNGLRGGEDRDTVATLVQESRDPFATVRNNSKFFDHVNDLLEVAGAGTDFIQLDKTSGATVLKDNDHWESQDSLDIQHQSCLFFGHLCSVDYNPLPMGYGRTDANSDGSQGDDLCKERLIPFLGDKSPTTWNCQYAMANGDNLSWNGIPGLHDLASRKSAGDPCSTNNVSDSVSVRYVTAVQKAGSATLTTQRLGLNNVDVPGPQGSPRMTDDLQNSDNLTTVSGACVFFLRPDINTSDRTQGDMPRHDGQHEFASLYNPYWQARLTTPDSDWVKEVYILIGNAGLDQATQ